MPFEVVAYDRGPDDGRTLTITSVIRDDHALSVNYEIVPPLSEGRVGGPHGEAEDDLGNWYDGPGGAYGYDSARNRTNGVLSFALPVREASQVTARIEWNWRDTWNGGAHVLQIKLGRTGT